MSWRLWAALSVVTLVAIPLVMRDYVALQNADSALDFRRTLDGDATRATVAGLVDVVFAVSYGVLGVIGLQRLGNGSAPSLVGLLTVCFGAAADVAENVYLVVNVAGRAHLANDDVALMQVFGAVKWVALLGYLLLVSLVLRRVWPRSPTSE